MTVSFGFGMPAGVHGESDIQLPTPFHTFVVVVRLTKLASSVRGMVMEQGSGLL